MTTTKNIPADRSRTVLRSVCATLCNIGPVTRADMVHAQTKVRALTALAEAGKAPTDRQLAHAIFNFAWMVEPFLLPQSNGYNAKRQALTLRLNREAFEIVQAYCAV